MRYENERLENQKWGFGTSFSYLSCSRIKEIITERKSILFCLQVFLNAEISINLHTTAANSEFDRFLKNDTWARVDFDFES